jgi:serine protease AprX
MNKFIFCFFCLITFLPFSQAQTGKYIIQFTDKKNSPFRIEEPSAFLTDRAIIRRIRQGIPIVENDLPPNPSYIKKLTECGAKFLHQSRWLNTTTVLINDSSTLNKIRVLPFVKSVKKTNILKCKLPYDYKAFEIKSGTDAEKKYGLNLTSDNYDYGLSFNQVNQIGGVCLHNQGFDGASSIICVLDAGFKNADTLSCFDSIRSNGQLLGTWDFVDNEIGVYEDNDHGSMVLSCMASNLPSVLVGTAPKASYWLLRTENAGSELIIEEDNWLAGAEFADSIGADVINSSLGYTLFDSAYQNHTWADLDGNTATATIAADIAASKGIIVCNSAGNEGSGSWKYISVPADADSILSVGAVDANGVRAGFSGVGPTADGRIKPDVAATGNGTYVIAPWSGSVIQSGGTSFSSPLIAGMTACISQANANKTNMEIISAIKNSGNQASNPDTLLGWGIPNFCLASGTLSGIQYLYPKNKDELSSVFYNSDEGVFYLYYFSTTESTLDITFNDMSGKILLSDQRKVKKGNTHFFKIENAHALSSGIYVLNIISADSKISKKIFKP